MKTLQFIITLLFVSVLFSVHAEEVISQSTCRAGICVENGSINLTDEDINDLKEILSEDEHPDHKYEIISIKSIIPGYVYLLSASKPHHYGIQIVLSKEGTKWLVLKKVKSIY